jgi:hypothetical protein
MMVMRRGWVIRTVEWHGCGTRGGGSGPWLTGVGRRPHRTGAEGGVLYSGEGRGLAHGPHMWSWAQRPVAESGCPVGPADSGCEDS